MQHGTHALDQLTSSTRAHGEQFCDLPSVDELSSYFAQCSADLRYAFRPIRQLGRREPTSTVAGSHIHHDTPMLGFRGINPFRWRCGRAANNACTGPLSESSLPGQCQLLPLVQPARTVQSGPATLISFQAKSTPRRRTGLQPSSGATNLRLISSSSTCGRGPT